MITKTWMSNDKYRNGIDYVVKVVDRFGRIHLVQNFIGTIFYTEYPYSNANKPYNTIKWIGKFILNLHGVDTNHYHKSFEFDNLEDALNFMYDQNDHYIGDLHQCRELSNGTIDWCCVDYNTRTYKGVA